ncbi:MULTISPECIES: hypothetical protein [unclassified Mesorhizobium]|uniref:hypothetical protein n=1 Tax=unclassified Mesorhizobium TaxID=325217 RepID=UPI000FD4F286|nr:MULTISPECIES: hypothetical protein [unclassified Mesorhizobium]RUV91887.1 hypothetical protein EOA88_09705 [Mesorhizobium sp. M5C.F.Ca.IN.020.14.1.1]RUV32295.1 hypothetical protein EOA86_02905 [Mesorhizobium sp. M5C.F.Ca.IN.020.32.2.1]RWG51395.1 MAG: hypothetical protein EOQ62_01525 [Mesorhizobium sp.]RWH60092.1 MAG: hypothetical protein EOQ82_00695 [Mesorhizobium sp.]RWI80595.1 MAG: hypothetical protein EOR19_00695 [Mesorhizobium sp.]
MAAASPGPTIKCAVMVAKLDRLSRDVAFTAGLMVQRVRSSSPTSALMPIHAAVYAALAGKEATDLRTDEGRPRLAQEHG